MGEVSMCCKSVCFITVMVVTINMIDVLFITSHTLNSLDGGKDEWGASFILLESCEFKQCQSHDYKELTESHGRCM